jgi:hypothetical protein
MMALDLFDDLLDAGAALHREGGWKLEGGYLIGQQDYRVPALLAVPGRTKRDGDGANISTEVFDTSRLQYSIAAESGSHDGLAASADPKR